MLTQCLLANDATGCKCHAHLNSRVFQEALQRTHKAISHTGGQLMLTLNRGVAVGTLNLVILIIIAPSEKIFWSHVRALHNQSANLRGLRLPAEHDE